MRVTQRLRAAWRQRHAARPYSGPQASDSPHRDPYEPEVCTQTVVAGRIDEDMLRSAPGVRRTMTGHEKTFMTQSVRYVERFQIQRALVECGVWRGGC